MLKLARGNHSLLTIAALRFTKPECHGHMPDSEPCFRGALRNSLRVVSHGARVGT